MTEPTSRVPRTARSSQRGEERPVASLSLDLDNDWSYRMVRAMPDWVDLPSYLPTIVPRAIELCRRTAITITFFVVGKDAAGPDASFVGDLARAGHEIGNHSWSHRPWMDRDGIAAVADEIRLAEEAITAATGQRPFGYRGPGYSISGPLVETLAARGYRYDASTLPTWIGPVARAAYFRSAKMSADERDLRRNLYGHVRDGVRPVTPYQWATTHGPLLEIPVTTLPALRVPMHFSYLLTLATVSPAAARTYFAGALATCVRLGVEPSLLLHPLDLLDGTDAPALAFFPGMGMPSARKVALIESYLTMVKQRFTVLTVGAHAERLRAAPLPQRTAKAA